MRLSTQRLSDHHLDTPTEVVRHLGAVQAQDYHQAMLGVAIRTGSATVADVEAAIQRREIVRTWGMRGTLHLVPTTDAEWMRRLFAPGILAKTTQRAWDHHDVDQTLMDRAAAVLVEALAAGNAIRRAELSSLLIEAGVANDSQQHYIVYGHLSHLGMICHGPRDHRKDTFALFDKWAPQQRALSGDDAVAELAQRFFTSHGPATLADFANWSGLGRHHARTGVESLSNRLVCEVFNDTEYWLPGDAAEGSGTHLLPGYDEFNIGYADRHHMFTTYGDIPISTSNGMFYPTIIVDGQVAGTWKRRILNTRVAIDARVVPAIDRSSVEAAAHRLGTVQGLRATTHFGQPPKR